jgi:hypothetical protein
LHAIGGLLDGVDGVEGGMRSYVEITNPDTGDVAATFIVTTALVDSATRSALPVPVPETSAAAVLASQALLDQVFLDGPLGDFDSEPYLINGCSSASYCTSSTPTDLLFTPSVVLVYSARAENNSALNFPHEDRTTLAYGTADFHDTYTEIKMVYAKWNAQAVPEPSTALLLSLGLLGFSSINRRRASR